MQNKTQADVCLYTQYDLPFAPLRAVLHLQRSFDLFTSAVYSLKHLLYTMKNMIAFWVSVMLLGDNIWAVYGIGVMPRASVPTICEVSM